MVKRLRNLGYLLVALSYLPHPAYAQKDGEESYIQRDVTFYGFGGQEATDLYFFPSPENPKTFTYQNWGRSVVYQYRGPAEFTLYRKVPGEGELPPTYEAVASTTIPTSAKNVLMLIATSVTDGVRNVQLYAVNYDETAFAANTLGIYNTMSTTFAAAIGEKRFPLFPGMSQPIPLGDMVTFASNRFAVAAVILDGPKIVLDVDVNFAEGKRYLYVLLPPKREGSRLIRAIRIIDTPGFQIIE